MLPLNLIDSALLLIAFIVAAWLYIRVKRRGYL